MKRLISFSAFVFLIVLSACGPAAEDRQMMHSRAKVFQDSIANVLRLAIQEAEVPAANQPVQPDTGAPRLETSPRPAQAPTRTAQINGQ